MKNLTTRKFSGIRQAHVNEVVWNIYGIKFYKNEDCFKKLVRFAKEDVNCFDVEIDCIVPIQPRNSGSQLVPRLAAELSHAFNFELQNILMPSNRATVSRADIKGKTVLLIDDVFYTGKTSAKAYEALKKLRPRTIVFYALAKSISSK